MPSRIAFSIPAHECVECLERQIANISSKVPESVFVISLSANNSFNQNAERLSRSENVVVNPESQPTFWGDCFYQHISNYRHARDSGLDFGHWAFEASNTILVRDGLGDHLRSHDALMTCNRDAPRRPDQKGPMPINTNWWGLKFKEDERFMRMAKENGLEVFTGWVEGMSMRRDLMEEAYDMISRYGCDDHRPKSDLTYPREEVYLQTIFFNRFHGRVKHAGTYCHDLRWGLGTKAHGVEMTLESFPDVYSLKPAPRRPEDQFRSLLESVASEGVDEYFERRRKRPPGARPVVPGDYEGKEFLFGNPSRTHGTVRLVTGGRVEGYRHFNESYWRSDPRGNLLLVNGHGVATSLFHSEKDGGLLGEFCDGSPHWLRAI